MNLKVNRNKEEKQNEASKEYVEKERLCEMLKNSDGYFVLLLNGRESASFTDQNLFFVLGQLEVHKQKLIENTGQTS